MVHRTIKFFILITCKLWHGLTQVCKEMYPRADFPSCHSERITLLLYQTLLPYNLANLHQHIIRTHITGEGKYRTRSANADGQAHVSGEFHAVLICTVHTWYTNTYTVFGLTLTFPNTRTKNINK